MAVNLSPFGGVGAQFLDNSGNVLTGGKILTYAAGTTTPQTAYTSSVGNIPLPNPIILNAAGRVPTGEIWLTDGLTYKFVLTDSNDVLIATYDNITGINSNFVAFTNEQEIQTATAGQTVFNLATITYQPGTNNLSVFVDGVNQYGPGAQYAYLETDSDTVTFVNGLHVGAEVKFTTSQLNSSGLQANAFQVSYTPPFTNSVGTNVGDKLAQTVSVMDFGAVGDGVTDDTAAFQNAMDSAAYVHVLIPDGNYLITDTLVVTTQVTLTGPDGGSQEMQTARLIHSTTSAGELFNVTAGVAGVCLKNFRVTGGNGSFCIVSSNSYVNYEFIYMQDYDGGGIQLLNTGDGSSSSRISKCEWVGPASATNYTGFEINVNGGDVHLESCTAIRGAIGIDIQQGQTIVVDKCSVNKQTRNPNVTGGATSSASQFDTCGIRLSSSAYKQAISIRNSYIETCDNGVYVESCESLSIEDNIFQDNGAAGNGGAWVVVGNSAINLVDSSCKNVTIRNNNFIVESNGSVTDAFYPIYFNDAANVIYENNYLNRIGDYVSYYYLTTSTSVYQIANTLVTTTGTPVASYDPSNLIRTFAYEITGTFTPALSSSGATFSYAVQQGFYKKIGDIVWFSIDIQLNTTGNTLTSNGLLITGLPFAALNTANQRNVVNAIFSNVASASSLFSSGFVLQGDTRIQLYSPVTTGTSLAVITSNFLSPTAGSFIGISGWYKAQS